MKSFILISCAHKGTQDHNHAHNIRSSTQNITQQILHMLRIPECPVCMHLSHTDGFNVTTQIFHMHVAA